MGLSYLTNEEQAVIDAMRMGGKVHVNFYQSDYGKMDEHLDRLDKADLFNGRTNMNLTHTTYFQATSENVQIGHFIDK